MINLEIKVDEATLVKAKEVLEHLGLDLNMAINIYLRRIVIDKGLPISMVTEKSSIEDNKASEKSHSFENQEYINRSQSGITREMVDEVWKAFIKYYNDLEEISKLSDQVAAISGMNKGSALIYLNVLSNLVKGEPNTRTMKMDDLKYFLNRIKTNLGDEDYLNAIKSLRLSVPYWKEKLAGKFGEKVEALCAELTK